MTTRPPCRPRAPRRTVDRPGGDLRRPAPGGAAPAGRSTAPDRTRLRRAPAVPRACSCWRSSRRRRLRRGLHPRPAQGVGPRRGRARRRRCVLGDLPQDHAATTSASGPDDAARGRHQGHVRDARRPLLRYLGPRSSQTDPGGHHRRVRGHRGAHDVEDAAARRCQVVGDACGLRVVEVMPGSPALAAGLLADDVVTAVDGRPLQGTTSTRPWRLMRGPRDSEVRLTARPGRGTALELAITRGLISSQDVRSAVLADGRRGLPAHRRLQRQRGRGLRDGAARPARRRASALRHRPARRPGWLRGRGGGHRQPVHRRRPGLLGGGRRAARQRAIDVRGGGLATDPDIAGRGARQRRHRLRQRDPRRRAPGRGARRARREPTFGKGTIQEWTQLPGDSGRLPPVGRQVADARQALGARRGPDAGRDGDAQGGDRFWPSLCDGAVDDGRRGRRPAAPARRRPLLLDESAPGTAIAARRLASPPVACARRAERADGRPATLPGDSLLRCPSGWGSVAGNERRWCAMQDQSRSCTASEVRR